MLAPRVAKGFDETYKMMKSTMDQS